MSLYLVDFDRLQRPEHAVALMIAGFVQHGDRWLVRGPLSTGLQHVLDRTRVTWMKLHDDIATPLDAIDMTGHMIRMTEVEHGLACYACETPYGPVVITWQTMRYRVLVDGQFHGVYPTPRAALFALRYGDGQHLPIGRGGRHTFAECSLPADIYEWTVHRQPIFKLAHVSRGLRLNTSRTSSTVAAVATAGARG
jgi:hypothetical protein